MLLVEVPEGHRVGQNLVQVVHALLGHGLGERVREPGEPAESLDLGGSLVHEGAGAVFEGTDGSGLFCHFGLLFLAYAVSRFSGSTFSRANRRRAGGTPWKSLHDR